MHKDLTKQKKRKTRCKTASAKLTMASWKSSAPFHKLKSVKSVVTEESKALNVFNECFNRKKTKGQQSFFYVL